jgi:outer membrane protein OmpA-like peptidoglycan-associated protein/tetratricopeptide (TPR) repeat protein
MKKSLIVFGILAAFPLCAQTNVEFEKDNFPGNKEGLKEAKRNLEDGYELWKMGTGMGLEATQAYVSGFGFYPNSLREATAYEAIDAYKNAVPLLLKAQEFNPNNALLNFRLGVAYYNMPDARLKALPYFEKAYKLNGLVDPEIHYYLGRVYHLNLQWDKAIEEYKLFKAAISAEQKKDLQRIAEMDKKVTECQNGKEFVKTPQRVFIDNVGSGINTNDQEYSPVITADASTMFFTSVRPSCTGGAIDGQYKEDVFMSTYKDGKWQPAVNIGDKINSKNHDASVAISPDGQMLYIYRGDNGGDLYQSMLKGVEWSEPERMNKNINTSMHEPSCGISYDGKLFTFISSRKEGSMGARDIWMSKKDEKGNWGTAVNGGTVNTKYNEEAIFVHPDGKTFYFASQGHKTMGGYDIFKVTYENGKWSEPENLGYPINGPDDDVFFVISGSGRHGYFASSKSGGDLGQSYGGMDIYKITFLGPEKPLTLGNEDNLLASVAQPVKSVSAAPPVEIKTAQITILKGVVTDAISQKPVAATIELVDNEKREIIATFTANSSTGKYLVSLPSGKNYGIAVKAEGYLFHSENFDIPLAAGYQEVIKDVQLKPVAVGSVIVLRNIFFDYTKATLRPESQVELERLVKLLNDVPTMKIEISGHTDKRGDDDSNMRLSQNRAQSVVDFLVSKGISRDRLTAMGYGETKLVSTGTTEEDHQQNRRTEFKILSK